MSKGTPPAGKVRLTFLVKMPDGVKKCNETVDITIANNIPLFRRCFEAGWSAEASSRTFVVQHETTLTALRLYKNYKDRIPIPSGTMMRDKLDFVLLATYLEEPLNENGIPDDLYSEVAINPPSQGSFQLYLDSGLELTLQDEVGCYPVETNLWTRFRYLYEQLEPSSGRGTLSLFHKHHRIAPDDDYRSLFGDEQRDDAVIRVLRDIDGPKDLFGQSELKWHRDTHHLLERRDKDIVMTLLLVLKRLNLKVPSDLLPLMLPPVYEDQYSLFSSKFWDFGKQFQDSLMMEYLDYCFGWKAQGLAGLYEQFELFMTEWPDGCQIIWDCVDRTEFMNVIYIPTKRQARIRKAKTVQDVLDYLWGEVEKLPMKDPMEQHLRNQLWAAQNRVGFYETFKGDDIAVAEAALARYLRERKSKNSRDVAAKAIASGERVARPLDGKCTFKVIRRR